MYVLAKGHQGLSAKYQKPGGGVEQILPHSFRRNQPGQPLGLPCAASRARRQQTSGKSSAVLSSVSSSKLMYLHLYKLVWICDSQPGTVLPTEDIWQCLETFLGITPKGKRSCSHRVGGDQGCWSTSYNTWDSPQQQNYPGPSINSADIDKLGHR